MQEVSGSIPLGSTIFARMRRRRMDEIGDGKNGGAKRPSGASDSVARREGAQAVNALPKAPCAR